MEAPGGEGGPWVLACSDSREWAGETHCWGEWALGGQQERA